MPPYLLLAHKPARAPQSSAGVIARVSTGWQTLYLAGHGSDPAALATPVGNAMIRYLVQFAATGDPNAGVAGARCLR